MNYANFLYEKFTCYTKIVSSFRTFRKKTAFFFGIFVELAYLCIIKLLLNLKLRLWTNYKTFRISSMR